MLERIIVGELRTNCYFFSFNKKECLIIDPGGDASRIIASVEVLNIIPVGIIFTHGHFDHTLAANAIREHYKKKNIKLKIGIHAADRTYLGKNAKRANLKHFKVLGVEAQVAFEKLFELLPEPDLILKEGDDVFKSGLKVIETPGHTPGSICLYSKRESILFTGDTLFFEGIGRSDLPGGNEKTLLKSIHEKLMGLPPETNVYPGHGPFTSLEREAKGNPYLELLKK
jgi:hydroxyacylglutathione hydrolase